MDIKQLVGALTIGVSCFCTISFSQEPTLTTDELAKLRKTPDTSQTVYITAKDKVAEASISTTEQGQVSAQTYEDPENPGVFISVPQPSSKKNKTVSQGISFGEMKGVPISKVEVQQSNTAALYSGIDLDQHSLRIAANCETSNTEGSRGSAVIDLDGFYYVIPTSTGSLPPLPPLSANQTVMGVDQNKNCVRDDVEHFIFANYGSKSQTVLRQHLYTHAIWLRFYLIDGISDLSIQAVSRQLLKTGLCLNKMIGIRESQRAQTEVFALMHDTDARTLRYFNNEELLTGFDVDISAPSGC